MRALAVTTSIQSYNAHEEYRPSGSGHRTHLLKVRAYGSPPLTVYDTNIRKGIPPPKAKFLVFPLNLYAIYLILIARSTFTADILAISTSRTKGGNTYSTKNAPIMSAFFHL